MLSPSDSYTNRKQIIEEWGRFVKLRMDAGWLGYLITLKFEHIPGSERKRLALMERELERVYAILLTRLFRRPHAAHNRGKLPVWIAAPDYPVAKLEKQLLTDVTINDGLHTHAAALFHPEMRMKGTIEQHFDDQRHVYIHKPHELLWIDATPITTNEAETAKYGFKGLIKSGGNLNLDNLVILPRHSTEVRGFVKKNSSSGTRKISVRHPKSIASRRPTMLRIFSNYVRVEITRLKINRNRRLPIGRVRLEIQPTIDRGPVQEHIIIKGLEGDT